MASPVSRADDKAFGEIVRWLAKRNLRWREHNGQRVMQKRQPEDRQPLLMRPLQQAAWKDKR